MSRICLAVMPPLEREIMRECQISCFFKKGGVVNYGLHTGGGLMTDCRLICTDNEIFLQNAMFIISSRFQPKVFWFNFYPMSCRLWSAI